MGLVIRYATIEDAKLIADISHQTFYETFAANNTKEDMHKFLNEQFTKGKLMMEVGARENLFLLAYDQHEVAGYVKLRDSRVPLPLKNTKAFEVARENGVITIGFTGLTGGVMKTLSDHLVNVPSSDTPRIQESHIMIGHIICQLVEEKFFQGLV